MAQVAIIGVRGRGWVFAVVVVVVVMTIIGGGGGGGDHDCSEDDDVGKMMIKIALVMRTTMKAWQGVQS